MLSRGAVIDVSESSIIVLEADLVQEGDVEYEYGIDEETEFHHIESAEELEIGDFVEVVFEEDEGIKRASRIALK